jgi:hypothetical protein
VGVKVGCATCRMSSSERSSISYLPMGDGGCAAFLRPVDGRAAGSIATAVLRRKANEFGKSV